MKNLILLLILFSLQQAKSQVSRFSKIKIMQQDSGYTIAGADTSFIYNAYVITQQLGGIGSVTLVCKSYNAVTSQWVMQKDTTYSWSAVTVTGHNNQAFKACKPNQHLLKLCLGRLNYATHRKFIFTVTGSNGILTKEFDF